MSALTMNFVNGKRIGYNGTTCTPQPTARRRRSRRPTKPRSKRSKRRARSWCRTNATKRSRPIPSLPSGYEAHATIDEYYKDLGPDVPVKSLAEEVARRQHQPAGG